MAAASHDPSPRPSKSANSKTPPLFTGGAENYSRWKRELSFWKEYTDLKPEEVGFAILFRVEDQEAKDAIMNLEMDKIKCAEGYENITKCMDSLFEKDKNTSMYEAYSDFENYRRSKGTGITKFINEFEAKYQRTKTFKIEMSENLLAFRLLKCANLTNNREELARATIEEWTYDEMKKKLKQIFGDSKLEVKEEASIVEDICQLNIEEEQAEDMYYYRSNRNPQFRGRGRATNRMQNFSRTRYRGTSNRTRGRNPIGRDGHPSTCSNCGSRNHWARDCPDGRENKVFEINSIELFQTDYEDENKLKSLVSDTFDAAVLDSAATKTAAGRVWTEDYISKLSEREQHNLNKRPSNSIYKFGDGQKTPAMYAITIPATIGKEKVTIDIDVLDKDIPCLLSKDSMKQTKAQINFENDELTILNQKVPMFTTKSGHYCIPLTEKKKIITKTQEEGNCKITLLVSNKSLTPVEIAKKLHSQFSHPSATKLVALARSAKMENLKEIVQAIRTITENCQICKIYRRAPRRPIVGLPLATRFNQCVQLDLFFIDMKTPILHMIDHVTKLSNCTPLKSKTAESILEGLMKSWIGIYGSPENFYSDNGKEFSNEIIKELGEKFNITVKTTPAESPWSNGLNEKYNGVLKEMILKTIEETGCSIPIATTWATNARNSLQNVNGYSPYTLVYGRNPNLPCITNSKLPALSEDTECKLLNENLNAITAARKAHIEAEASSKIKRALNHNIRSTNNEKYFTGDRVFYKRKDSKKWHGPGTVLGQDGQTVLIKHGGTYVRVHPCRITLEHGSYQTKQKEVDAKKTIPQTTPEYTTDSEEYTSDEAYNEDDRPIINENTGTEPEEETEHEHEQGQETDPEQEIQEEPEPLDELRQLLDSYGEPETEEINPEQNQITNENKETEEQANPKNEEAETENPLNQIQLDDHNEDINTQEKEKKTQIEPSQLRKGMTVACQLKHDRRWYKVTIGNRSGKATGIYKYEYNTTNEKGENMVIDFNNQVIQILKPPEHKQPSETKEKDEAEMENDEIINTIESNEDQKLNAKLKELESWNVLKVYQEIEDQGQKAMTVKWVLREKLKDNKPFTKARLCVRGFEEENENIRDSPTAMKESIRFCLTVAATEKWNIESLDVKTAFLQSNKLERQIIIRPPKEAQTNKLWQLIKPAYGLGDASRLWYLTVRDKLTKMGIKVSIHDQGLFYLKSNEGRLESIIIVFVDDLLVAGKDTILRRIESNLKEIFTIGAKHINLFQYIGMSISQKDNYTIELEQKNYINSIEPIKIEHPEEPEREASKADKKKLRSLTGKLNWALMVSRPDIGFDTRQLSTILNQPLVKDLHRANKILKHLKGEPLTLKFSQLTNTDEYQLIVMADASYGNLRSGHSQEGYVILICDSQYKCCLLSWNSLKIKRVCKSTLTSETLALGDAIDHAILLSTIYGELISNKPKYTIPITALSDNESLVKASATTNLITEKRLRIEIAAMRESVDNGEIKLKWIDSKNNISNCLKKFGASPKGLQKVMTQGKCSDAIIAAMNQ